MNSERRYDIDWLRVLSMIVIFVFHCSRYFDREDWHVKNSILYNEMSWITGIISQWIMPLFFVLSAISVSYSLRSRGNGQYLLERIKRLLIPFILGTFVILIPIQVYIERVSHGNFIGSFWKFYPHYFDGFYAFGGNFAWMGLHLWYLEMLFVFSLITLPFFRFLLNEKRQGFAKILATFFYKPLRIYLLFVPITLVEIVVNLDPDGIGMRAFGGWSLLTYLMIFILGFTIGMDPKISLAIENQRFFSLLFLLILTGTGILLLDSGISSRSLMFAPIRSLNMWCWLFAIMGFVSHHLRHTTGFLQYANRAVLPFYVLHQTLIVGIGFLLINWQAGLIGKWLVLAILSFVAIMVVYEFFIRRLRLLQLFFGMKS